MMQSQTLWFHVQQASTLVSQLLTIGLLGKLAGSVTQGVGLLPAVRPAPFAPVREELDQAGSWIRYDFLGFVRDYEKLSREPVSAQWVKMQWEAWKRKYPQWRKGPTIASLP